MRPRLPLCLLPFVGAVTIFMSFSTSEAASYSIENYLSETTHSGARYLYSFGFNLAANRPDGASDKNILFDETNTFTFIVNDNDGMIHNHPGLGTYHLYESPITLSAKGSDNVSAGNYGNIITVAGTLNIKSQYNASAPMCGISTHDWVDNSMVTVQHVPLRTWTYVSQMGFASLDGYRNSTMVVDFSANSSVETQNFVIGSKVNGTDLTVYGLYGYYGELAPTPTYVLQKDKATTGTYDLKYDTDVTPAHFTMNNLTVSGSNTRMIYSDADGRFVLGMNENNTFEISKSARFYMKSAAYVEVKASTVVDNGFLIIEGTTTPNSGGYDGGILGASKTGVHFNTVTIKNSGAMYVHLNEVAFDKALNIVQGGAAIFTGKNFVITGATTIDGYSEMGYDRSTLVLNPNSSQGIFGGKVSVTNYGVLRVEGNDIEMRGGLSIKDDGTLVMGALRLRRDSLGALVNPVNNFSVTGGISFGANARVEVSTLNQTMVNGVPLEFTFSQDVYFAIFKPIEEVTSSTFDRIPEADIPYEGNITLKNGAKLTLTAPLASVGQEIDTGADGNYEMKGIISGNGSVNLQAKSGQTRYTLSGENTYTGSTTITLGILEITNENYNGSKVVSSSLGSGNSKLVFSNNPTWYSTPGLAFSSDYNGIATWGSPAELHRDIQIGTHANGNSPATALIIAGRYNVVSDDGESMQEEAFASNVTLYGNITSLSGVTGVLVKGGDGKVTLAGSVNVGSGAVNIMDGTLALLKNGTINKAATIVFSSDDKNDNINTPMVGTLSLGANMTELANNIELDDQGRIDATATSGVFALKGNIYTVPSNMTADKRLHIFGSTATGETGLYGTVNIGAHTINYYGTGLIIAGKVIGTETVFDLSGKYATIQQPEGEYYNSLFDNAYGNADIIFDTTNASTSYENGSGKYSAFLAKVVGAKDLIKTGTNDLLLGSDFSDGLSYTGATIIENGALIMYGEGKLSTSTTLDVRRDTAEGTQGEFRINGTEQSVYRLIGNGVVNLDEGGILHVTNSHNTQQSFSGVLKGNGTLSIERVFYYSGYLKGDPEYMETNGFTGTYLIADTGTLVTRTSGVLSENAQLLMDGDNAKLQIGGTTQTIGALNSEYAGAIVDFGTTGAPDLTGLTIGKPYNQETEGVPTGTGHYKGNIIGDGYLVKQGSGTFILDGLAGTRLNYTGTTTVKEGTLYLTGANITNSEFTVEDRGTLFVDVNDGDSSINKILLSGTLEMTGTDYTFRVNHMTLDSATLKLTGEITGYDAVNGYNNGACTTLIIDGIVDFAPNSGQNLFDLTLRPGNWGRDGGTRLELFRANLTSISDVDEYFAVTNDYVFLNLEMSKEGFNANDTMITVQVDRDKKVTFTGVTGLSFASILDAVDKEYGSTGMIGGTSSSMLTDLMDRFYVMKDAKDVIALAESLSGASVYILPMAELEEHRRHVNTLRNRATSIGLRSPNEVLRDEEYNVWGLGLASQSSLSSDGNVPGYDKDTWGGMIGFDMPVSSDLAWGMSFSYTNSDISVKNGDSITLDSYFMDVFARYQQDHWSYTGIFTLGMGSGDTERRVDAGDIGGTARGSSDSVTFSLYGEAGYDILLQENWVIQPFGSVLLGNYHTDGYSESGLGDAGLKVSSMDHFVTRIGAGARGIYSFAPDSFEQVGRIEVRALVTQDLTDVSPDVSRGFINSSSGTVDAEGSGVGKTAFEIGVGAQIPVAYNVNVFADVSGEFRSEQTSVYGHIGVRVTF